MWRKWQFTAALCQCLPTKFELCMVFPLFVGTVSFCHTICHLVFIVKWCIPVSCGCNATHTYIFTLHHVCQPKHRRTEFAFIALNENHFQVSKTLATIQASQMYSSVCTLKVWTVTFPLCSICCCHGVADSKLARLPGISTGSAHTDSVKSAPGRGRSKDTAHNVDFNGSNTRNLSIDLKAF